MGHEQKELILVGGGGHCRSVIDVLETEGSYKVAGIIDLPENVGKTVLSYPVIGSDSDLEGLLKYHRYFLVTLGHIRGNKRRKALFNMLRDKGCNFPTVISPLAYVSKYARIGEGSIVLHSAVVNASASVGANCIVNTSSLIEHDSHVGDHSHIAPAACINGGCIIENDCFIGSHATIIQGLRVGAGSLIAAGAVVRADVESYSMIAGNPGTKKKGL